MSSPLHAGPPLPAEQWQAVRMEAIFRCCKWDVQSGDQCALARFPLLIDRDTFRQLSGWAESLSAEVLAAEQELLSRRELLAKLGMPRRVVKALCDGRQHGACAVAPRVMRFDFHLTTDGWRISEVNSDVPGGYIEASGITELMSAHFPHTAPPPNPAQFYADAISRSVPGSALVALVHATAYSDDGEVMEYIAGELRSRGVRTCLLSPEHLSWEGGRARIDCRFAQGYPDLIVRFFPAEWLPNLSKREYWWGYFSGGVTPVSNPGSALLIQSKCFPLTWDSLAVPLPTWRELMPKTVMPRGVSDLESGCWVLKSALGRVGDGVVIPGVAKERVWKAAKKESLRHPSAWVAQKRFEVIPVEAGGKLYYPCLGLFTVDGRACGVYGRMAEKTLIDGDAQDVAVLIN